MTIRWINADVFDGLAQIEDESVDLVVTSPPFLALRSYLPADHPDKNKEIGSEATPAAFIDVMLEVTTELRRVLAPHGSIAIELGDTFAGSGGAGGDYDEGGLRERQEKFLGSGRMRSGAKDAPQDDDGGYQADQRVQYEGHRAGIRNMNNKIQGGGPGWPLAKSKTLMPQLYEVALAYGINPLTGQPSPAGQWRIRNVVTWARPNPPVGALGDKWRPATSDVVVACVSEQRYWDDLATRRPFEEIKDQRYRTTNGPKQGADPAEVLAANYTQRVPGNAHGAPLLDYWEIPPGGYKGSHYAVFPPALVEPLIKAMCPLKVCRECGKPPRRVVEFNPEYQGRAGGPTHNNGEQGANLKGFSHPAYSPPATLPIGWSDCGHDDYRPGIVLDPFAGSGTTLAVASGHGHDAIGIDLDSRNEDLARERVGPLMWGAS